MESSSSEIRIESDDENPESGEISEGNVVSTKTYRKRERVNSVEMEGDAGLEISAVCLRKRIANRVE